MDRYNTLRYEVFVRVSNFGMARRQQFPESSKAGQAFAALTAAVAEIQGHTATGTAAATMSRQATAALRAALAALLTDMARVASLVVNSAQGPGPFVLPAWRSDAGVVDTAHAFIRESAALEAGFITAGLPDGFRSTLQDLARDLEQTIGSRAAGFAARRVARTAVQAAMKDAAAAVRTLDIVIPVALRPDPASFAAWKAARRLRPKGTGATDTDTTTPGSAPEAALPKAS